MAGEHAETKFLRSQGLQPVRRADEAKKNNSLNPANREQEVGAHLSTSIKD